MNERTILISEYLGGDYSIAELARRRGISRKSVYKWIQRYEEDPNQGLLDLSRAPRNHPNAISVELQKSILDWKNQRPLWGAPKIHSKLLGRGDCPAESTVSNVLRRSGLTRQQPRRARPVSNAGPLSGLLRPNELWCVDFKGWFLTGDGQRCDPLTMSDGYSRFLICCQGIAATIGHVTVQPIFENKFREYGLPDRIRNDNGAPFASQGLGGLSVLSVWFLRLGIGLERIQPGHPEHNGRHERIHRTLKEAVLSPPRGSLKAQQKAFDEFVKDYNEERPHEALNQQPPAKIYTPSPRKFSSRLPEPEYPEWWEKRAVRSNGEIKWKGEKIYLSQALVGQWIGLEPFGEELWKVHFMKQELGQLNERIGKVQAVQ